MGRNLLRKEITAYYSNDESVYCMVHIPKTSDNWYFHEVEESIKMPSYDETKIRRIEFVSFFETPLDIIIWNKNLIQISKQLSHR